MTSPYEALLDDDVRAIFDADLGHRPFGFEPLLAQLIVELRKTREAQEYWVNKDFHAWRHEQGFE